MARTNRRLIKLVSATHRCWYRATGGLVGGRGGGARFLLLTTEGRKSGKRRTMPLLYVEDGGAFVVIASNGGDDRHAGWRLNLLADPHAEVQIGRRRLRVVASEAAGEEKARLWGVITKSFPVYNRYRDATSREIPVIVLRPERGA